MSKRCHKLSKTRWYNFVPAFKNLSKGGTEIFQACGSCRMPGFCASIVLVFILRVELFDYVVDGGICESLAWGESQMVDMASKKGGEGAGGGAGGNKTLRTPCDESLRWYFSTDCV